MTEADTRASNGQRSPGDWRGRKVVVTGAGGFIGSTLTRKLLERGASVRAFVHYNSRGDIGHLKLLPEDMQKQIDVRSGDLRDHRAIAEVVENVDTVFHLGALIGIPYSYVNPIDVVQTNVLGTLNVLNACRDCGARMINTSTSEVYGTAQYAPIDEKHPLQAQSPYSATKIAADKICESYSLAFGQPVTIVRPFNTFGPAQSNRAVIPTIISQVLFGDNLRLGALDTTRDFTYVDDTAEGFLAAGLPESTIGEVVNLGTGIEVSIGQVVELVKRIVGRDLPVSVDDRRLRPQKSEVMRLISDNSKARRLAGWSPKYDVESGLKATVDFIASHPEMYPAVNYAI